MLQLCKECASRFEKDVFAIGECSICGGKVARFGELAERGALLVGGDWGSFSVSTTIPKGVLAAEEKAFDYSPGESIKTFANRYFSERVAAISERKYDPSGGDGRIMFDFRSFTARREAEPLFFFGRYKKLKEGLSQTKWDCGKCFGRGCERCAGEGRMYRSVEEIIGGPFVKRVGGAFCMHASGREDVDVVNTAGRPFVLEISNPEARKVDLEGARGEISLGGEVEVSDLKRVGRGAVELVADSHFPKTYRAWIEVAGGAGEGDLERIAGFSHMLKQQTPNRVVHRRADKIRERRAEVVRAEIADGMVVADILADAGTYIKELVSGDGGRTEPSFSSLLGKGCICKKLEVVEIEDDFLRLVLG
ncbi:MAG TPA: tRNA pseudouridine(54/55) synthase Pus10 [Candidatus Bilamarchaeaceae archaeon]|nr:tRNA pseudouridine(54/55) synthase Pus10 [Candidatus Bilamarchaeaceae archaeon]